jgi:AcrR family transcriptional regulator
MTYGWDGDEIELMHEAFIYRTDDEYAAVLAPFLSEAVEAGQRAVAVTSPARRDLLRDALGGAEAAVSFLDASEWYRRPGATLAAWAAELEPHGDSPPVRVIGEIEFGTDPAAAERWTRYESVFNRAFADRVAWVVCAYDARTLPEPIVASAHLTHPVVSTAAGRAPSPEHFAGPELAASLSAGRDRPGARLADAVAIGPGSDPLELRRALTWPARAAGLADDVLDDLLLAVDEVGSTCAQATVRAGAWGGEWFSEVEQARRAPGALPLDDNAIGVLIGRLICDRVELVHTETSQLVRFVFGSPKASPRERILAASGELFAEHGIRGAGINAIIERAGVAKATFYAQFRSKDELVAAWLQTSPAHWFEGIRAELEARASSPLERLTLLFDVVGEWLAHDELHGCRALGAIAEARRSETTRSTADDLDSELEDYLRSTARGAGLPDADALAAQLLLLVSGAIGMAAARGSASPLETARLAARSLVATRS